MKRIARCCCREIGVEVEGLPWLHAVCHCDNCKRRTGSAFGVSAYFEDDQIAILGSQGFGREKTLSLVIKKGIFVATVGQPCIGEQLK